MAEIVLDIQKKIGRIKPMNAVNNGPVKARADQSRGNFDDYAAARIPYARTHDAAICYEYGGGHTVDVNNIFPDFDADEQDPASYDFTVTDAYLKTILDAGTGVFYRLGSMIEHWCKKYNTLPPKDPGKWARICEHIILHYNEGWADGFHWNIEYWEIWNEPDLDPDDWPNKRTWGGTADEFAEFFKTAALHLKKCFPRLKIGGPACCGGLEWSTAFLKKMSDAHVPLDFYSWHAYPVTTAEVVTHSREMRALLDRFGYTKTESILNEFNYVRGWDDEWVYSIRQMTGMKGAALTCACMCALQNEPLDMLMYYDARIDSLMNGMFDILTLKRRKGYYAFYAFSELAELKHQVRCDSDDPDVYAVAAHGENGKTAALICYYTDNDDNTKSKEVTIRTGLADASFDCFMVDEDYSFEPVWAHRNGDGSLMFRLQRNSILFIRTK